MNYYRLNIEITDPEVAGVMRILPFESKSTIFRHVARHITDIVLNNPDEFSRLYSLATKKDIDAMLELTGLKEEE